MYIIGKKCGEKMKDYSEYFKGPNLKEAQKRSRKQVDHLKDAFEIPSDMVNVGKGKTYYIHTYGCQANERDGETLAGIFEMMGYTSAKEIEDADVILLNTCAIRENAEEKVFGKVGYVKNLKKKNPNLIFGLCGCMAQEEVVIKRILEKHPHIDLIFGTHNIHRLPTLLKEAMFNKEMVVEVWSKEGDVIENTPVTRANGHKAWVNIMYGCNKFCTYCIVPYTRGRERSRLPETILKEVKDALNSGFKEITLLGQNVDSYGKDFNDKNYRLADLLRDVNAIDGKFRIRFVTSYPTDITDELIKTTLELDKVCEYFHIPMQSGSSEVLKKMNRRYDRETYFRIANKVRKMVPDVTITSDFIAGFPGETEEQFVETLTAMEELGLDYSNTAAYSPREKTVAAKWIDKFIDEDTKFERLARLNEQNRKCCLASNQKFLGREMEVLIESFENHKGSNVITGRTRNNKIVHIPYDKDLTGEFVNVKITGVKTWYLKGEMI